MTRPWQHTLSRVCQSLPRRANTSTWLWHTEVLASCDRLQPLNTRCRQELEPSSVHYSSTWMTLISWLWACSCWESCQHSTGSKCLSVSMEVSSYTTRDITAVLWGKITLRVLLKAHCMYHRHPSSASDYGAILESPRLAQPVLLHVGQPRSKLPPQPQSDLCRQRGG